MKENLQEIYKKYSFPKRDINALVEVSDVEYYSNLKLPEDYVFYLENYFGIDQFIGVEFIKLWSLEEIIEANKSYKIVEELTATIGIGTNGSGEFIGIEIDSNKNNVKIILSPFIDLNSKYHVEIGTSFTDFLIKLDKGIEWFS
ncbi:SMI1/KNR4 family protein [Flavobacterium sp. KJJ]|uniref:SMI1/KNR4 family protein n=1 Tax=Flavobacterium sp. KJJ TaxID=1270193 RepID=UPI0004936EAC|nr:SMI1/KNR4 family protein [Flavobacterium sp. KJJ]